jgi:hypothetical protein
MRRKGFGMCVYLAGPAARSRGFPRRSTEESTVVGISTGSSGTSWRNIMIDALQTVGKI